MSGWIFGNRNFSFKLCFCCSYSLIECQNYLVVLVISAVFSQVMSNILKVSTTDSGSSGKLFLFSMHIFAAETFLFGSPRDYNVFKTSFSFVMFSVSFSSKHFFSHLWSIFNLISCVFANFPVYIKPTWFEFFK